MNRKSRPQFTRWGVKLIVTLAAALVGAAVAAAGTVTWDGGGDDLNWQNALNWDADILPGPGDDVVIPDFSPIKREFRANKVAHYMLRWLNTRGDKGPWSETASATIGA